MSHTEITLPLIYSSFGDDPDLGELVEMFVEEMPARIRALKEQADEQDWNELARIAHQLKGAAGSYGFDQLTPAAQDLELLARDGAAEPEIRDALNKVIDLCNRTRAGVAE
ncbi:MAG: Hpt domain-containing protein [Planctomycetota bacterium]